MNNKYYNKGAKDRRQGKSKQIHWDAGLDETDANNALDYEAGWDAQDAIEKEKERRNVKSF